MAGQNFSERLGRWMQGRNGTDELSGVVVGVAAVLVVLNLILNTVWMSWLALVLLAYALWRSFSRQIGQRQKENEAFLQLIAPLRRLGREAQAQGSVRDAAREMRTYRHLSCPSCGQRVRVPRGKGRIRVRCPSCGASFETKS